MTDNQNGAAREKRAIAWSSLFGEGCPRELFCISQDEIDAMEGLSPNKWPTAGQTKINWDLSVQGRLFTFPPPCSRVLHPASHTDFSIDSLALGKVTFTDFDPLLHPFFRLASESLWCTLDSRKLARVILHIAKGAPVSPGHLCVHDEGGFHWVDGTHRYEVLKRSGSPYLYFLAEPEDVPRIGTLVSVEWLDGCCP
ncbi:hypothetical protein [Lelliottia sp.]|uniref:hypothetical protein n=1 Tax=Lelliottia sp. TaxID=1898429 RepID=UPI00388E9011